MFLKGGQMLFRKLTLVAAPGLSLLHFLVSTGLLFLAICPASSATFSALDVFGDSTVDNGWWAGAFNGQCGAVAAPCATGNPPFDAKIQAAIAAGGTGAPVGVGLMNTQYLAQML